MSDLRNDCFPGPTIAPSQAAPSFSTLPLEPHLDIRSPTMGSSGSRDGIDDSHMLTGWGFVTTLTGNGTASRKDVRTASDCLLPDSMHLVVPHLDDSDLEYSDYSASLNSGTLRLEELLSPAFCPSSDDEALQMDPFGLAGGAGGTPTSNTRQWWSSSGRYRLRGGASGAMPALAEDSEHHCEHQDHKDGTAAYAAMLYPPSPVGRRPRSPADDGYHWQAYGEASSPSGGSPSAFPPLAATGGTYHRRRTSSRRPGIAADGESSDGSSRSISLHSPPCMTATDAGFNGCDSAGSSPATFSAGYRRLSAAAAAAAAADSAFIKGSVSLRYSAASVAAALRTTATGSSTPSSNYCDSTTESKSGSMIPLAVDSSINKNRWTRGKEIPLTPLPSARPLLAPRLRSSSPTRRSMQVREALKLMHGRYPSYMPGVPARGSLSHNGSRGSSRSGSSSMSINGSSSMSINGSSSMSINGSSSSNISSVASGASGANGGEHGVGGSGSQTAYNNALRWLAAEADEREGEEAPPQREGEGAFIAGGGGLRGAYQSETVPGLTRKEFESLQKRTCKNRSSRYPHAGVVTADSGAGRDSSGCSSSSVGGSSGSNSGVAGYGSSYHSRMRSRRERTRRSCSVGSAVEMMPQGRAGGASPHGFSFRSVSGRECDAGATREQHGLVKVEQQQKERQQEQQQKQLKQQQQEHKEQHRQYEEKQQPQQSGLVLQRPSSSRAQLEQAYVMEGVIGQGMWGIVTACRHRGSGERFACKTVFKRPLEEDGRLEQLRNEINILQTIRHPNVASVQEVFEDQSSVHIVMELCSGGDLSDYMSFHYDATHDPDRALTGGCSERDAAGIIRTVLQVVQRCHAMSICHRDLKLSNFMLVTASDPGSIRAIDFRSATRCREGEVLSEMAGSPTHMAPEVLEERYGLPSDVWSVGVMLYTLLVGCLPFEDDSVLRLFDKIKSQPLDLESGEWRQVSGGAKACVARLLEREPARRPTAAQALDDPWLKLFSRI